MIPVETTPSRVTRDELIAKDLQDEYLLYDHEGDRMHVLNRTARAIYLLCDGSRTFDEVFREFAELYSIDEDTARNDAAEAVEELVKLGLVALP